MIKHVATEAGVRKYKLPLRSPIIAKNNRITQFFTAQDQSLNYEQAKDALRSPRHVNFVRKSLEINNSYGAATLETRDLIGDTAQYGTEDSTMQRIRASAEISRVIAAEKGLAGNQLSVLNFVHSATGPDLMVSVKMPDSMSSKDLRNLLNVRGLEFRSIDPKTNELVFFSGRGEKLAEIKQLAKDFAGGRVSISRGTGEFVGSDESRAEAANVYRGILAGFRSKGQYGGGYGYSGHGIAASAKESSLDKLVRLSRRNL